MKKTLLLSAILALVGLVIPTSAQAAVKLSKTGWSVTVDSEEHSGESTNGRGNLLIDDNTATYWHTCWSQGTGEVDGKCPHFIVLDLGSDQTFHTVELIDRNDTGANGRVTACSIYASSCPIDYADESTWGGLITSASDLPTGQLTAKQIELGTIVTARYLMIKVTGTLPTGANVNKWACVAELNLYGPADYTTGLESTDNSTSDKNRKTESLSISDNNSHTLNLSNLQATVNDSPMFFDRSSEAITVEPGAVISLSSSPSMTWMHRYVYVDWDGDGFLYTDATSYFTTSTSTTLKTGVDLVAFDFYRSKNSDGATKNNGQGCQGTISFTVPENTTPGAYRARYKIDWDCLDPTGNKASGNTIQGNGGVIVDFTILVGITEIPAVLPTATIHGIEYPSVKEGDIALRLTENNGSKSDNDLVWTTTTNPVITLTANGGSFVTDTKDDNTSITFNTGGSTRDITVECSNPSYYVSGIRFAVRSTEYEGAYADNCTVSFNGVSAQAPAHAGNAAFEVYDIEEGTPVTLSVTPNKAELKRVILDAFTVILSPSSANVDHRPQGIDWIDETGFASVPNLYSAEAIQNVKDNIWKLPETATLAEVMDVARTIYAAALNKHLRFINVAADDEGLPHHHLAVSANATGIISSESESDLNSLWSLRAGETEGTYRLFCYGIQDYCGVDTRTISVTAENGSYVTNGSSSSSWAYQWISSESAPQLTISATHDGGNVNNFNKAITYGDLKYAVGQSSPSTLTFTCTEGWVITALSFTAVQDATQSVNITVGSDTYATTTDGVQISAEYSVASTEPVTITFAGSNVATTLRDFTVTLSRSEMQPRIASDFQIVIPTETEFEDLIAIKPIAYSEDYIHYDLDGNAITTGALLDDTGSQWLVGLADDLFAEAITGDLNTETDLYTIAAETTGEKIRKNRSLPENLVITITDAAGKSMTPAINVEESGVATIDCFEFPAGDYTITIPLGYFERALDGDFDTPDGYTWDYEGHFTITDNRAEAIDLLAGMANTPALWKADAVATASEKLMELGKKTATSEQMAAVIDPLYNSIIGKHVYFTNRHENNQGHRLAADTENQELTSIAAPDHNVKAIWEIVGTDTPGEYRLFNVHDELYADFSPESSHPNIPMSAEGVPYRISYPARHWDTYPIQPNEVTLEALGNCSEEAGHTDHHFLHDGVSNLNVSAFNNYHPASHWIVTEATPETVTFTYDDYGNITFSANGKEVTRNEYCTRPGLHYTIPAPEPQETEEPAFLAPRRAEGAESGENEPVVDPFEGEGVTVNDMAGTLADGNDQNQKLILSGDDVIAGDHRLVIPMGYFKVGDNGYSQAITTSFTKSQDGVVTSITEIGADTVAPVTEWYTIQGLRVAAPARGGVYIRRTGTKVQKIRY